MECMMGLTLSASLLESQYTESMATEHAKRFFRVTHTGFWWWLFNEPSTLKAYVVQETPARVRHAASRSVVTE